MGEGSIVRASAERVMEKSDFAECAAGEAGKTKRAAGGTVRAVFSVITGALVRGEDVTVAGFGRFFRKSRPAREGRNPRTGERIAIGPSSTGSFRAGKALKDAFI
jgi:DNA-binding protein HU-beta